MRLPGRLNDLHLDQSPITKGSSHKDDIRDSVEACNPASIPGKKPGSTDSILGKLLAQLSSTEEE